MRAGLELTRNSSVKSSVNKSGNFTKLGLKVGKGFHEALRTQTPTILIKEYTPGRSVLSTLILIHVRGWTKTLNN